MSNRAYLTVNSLERIYPSFGNKAFKAATNVVLACDGCVPLLWLAAFSKQDLATHRFRLKGKRTVAATAPLCKRKKAMERLSERASFLNRLFKPNGGVQPFIDALVRELGRAKGAFLSVEYEEIAALGTPEEFDALVLETLEKLDAGDAGCKSGLLELSTVIDDRRFRPPAAVARSKQREDRWNVFRLVGGGFVREAEWDFIAPNTDLSRMLAASRPRDTFGLYES